MKGKWKLKQDCAQLAGVAQRVESGAHRALVFRSRIGVVRELLPQLRGENKTRIGRHELNPLPAVFWLQRLVERGVDLNRVEELSKIGGLMEACRLASRVHDACPVG